MTPLPPRAQTLGDRLRGGPVGLRSYGITDAYTMAESDGRLPATLDPVRLRREFGLRGDGVAVQSAVVQDVFDAATARKLVIDFGDMVLPLDGPVFHADGLGFRFAKASYDPAVAGPGFVVTGTGYTALTITGAPTVLHFAIAATGQAVNLVHLSNPQRIKASYIRAYNAAGFGVKIDQGWDCKLDTISVEDCGIDAEEAFSLNDVGADTSNMTKISRLQVEGSLRRAIFISPNSLSCVIENIHSEGAVATAVTAGAFITGKAYTIKTVGTTDFTAINASANTVGVTFAATGAGTGTGTATPVTWILGGASGVYTGLRLHATTTDGKAWFRSAWNTYICPRVETASVDLEGTSGLGMTLIEPAFGSVASPLVVRETTGQTGVITIVGGDTAAIVAGWTGNASYRHIVGAAIEGTWTPVLTFGGATTGITYSTQSAQYTLQDRLLYVRLKLILTSKGSATGSATITGLPYAAAETAAVALAFYANITGMSARASVARIDASATTVQLMWNNVDGAPGALTDAVFANNSELTLTAVYRIA